MRDFFKPTWEKMIVFFSLFVIFLSGFITFLGLPSFTYFSRGIFRITEFLMIDILNLKVSTNVFANSLFNSFYTFLLLLFYYLLACVLISLYHSIQKNPKEQKTGSIFDPDWKILVIFLIMPLIEIIPYLTYFTQLWEFLMSRIFMIIHPYGFPSVKLFWWVNIIGFAYRYVLACAIAYVYKLAKRSITEKQMTKK